MKFYTRIYNNNLNYKTGNEEYPCVILVKNNRDDYGFLATFQIYYLENKEFELTDLGYIRIIQKGVSTTTIPKEFGELEKDKYFSRSHDSFLYTELNNKFSDKKQEILKGLKDISYLNIDRSYIENLKDNTLLEGYDKALYRNDYFTVTSSYAEDAKETIKKISTLSNLNNDPFMYLLLYGSLVTTLESYLKNAFIKKIDNNDFNIANFIIKHEWKSNKYKKILEKLYSENNCFSVNKNIKDYAKKEMEKIIFHDPEKVKKIFENILSIKIPNEISSFSEEINNRHCIFHSNGNQIDGAKLNINKEDIKELGKKILSFINRMEETIITQGKTENQ